MSTICPFCGAEIADGVKFCTACGNAVSAATSEVQSDVSAQEPIVETSEQSYSESSYSEPQTYNYSDSVSTEPKKGSGFAIASLVLGILSVLCCIFYFVTWIPAVLAIIFGIVAIVKKQSKGMAIAGIICGAIGLLLVLFIIISAVAVLQSPEMQDIMSEIMSEAGLSDYYNF